MFDSGWAAVAGQPGPSAVPPWSQWEPGPELAAALASSEPVDLADDEGFDAAERLAGWEALAHWATGRLYRETAHYLQARQARARGAGSGELASEAVAMEVATLARVAPRTGEVRVFQAETLLVQLPGTLAALEAGRISLAHARVVLEQTELCDPGTARAVDAELWSRPARERTPAQLRDLVRRIVARLDPELLRRRGEQAARKRALRYWSEDHGATGVLQLRLPADQARGVWSVIDAAARGAGDPAGGEQRDLDQTRADTTRDLVLDGATAHRCGQGPCRCSCSCASDGSGADDAGDEAPGGEAPGGEAPGGEAPGGDASMDDGPATDGDDRAGGDATDAAEENAAQTGRPTTGATREGTPAPGAPGAVRDPVRGLVGGVRSPVRTEVRVTIGWDVLAGLSDRPGELEGHGPIPAALARRLAGDPEAWWRRLFTDPVTGTAVHLDARRYRPPGSMREFVRAREVTCAAPGCRVPASRCDLDHVVPYEHDRPGGGAGATRPDKLKPGCRRHHRLKTLSACSAELGPDPDGGSAPVIIWTSPSGHRWWVRPPALDPPLAERGDDPGRTGQVGPVGRADLGPPGRGAPGRDSFDAPGVPADVGSGEQAFPEVDSWPRDIDSWRRREAGPRSAGPRRRPG